MRCSGGGHGKAQTVTWTGLVNSRRTALGLKIDWAYNPGEVKILTSSDGANFEEAQTVEFHITSTSNGVNHISAPITIEIRAHGETTSTSASSSNDTANSTSSSKH